MKRNASLLALFFSLFVYANEGTKVIEIEWEPIEKASGYEIRFTPSDGKKAILVKTRESRLAQELPIGKYVLQIRTRARDINFLSPWSDPMNIEVVEKEINPLKPEDKAIIESRSGPKDTIEFEWSPVENVKEYTLKVWNEKRKDNPWVFVTRATKKKLEVPAAEAYYWQVLFETDSAVSYQQQPTTFTFLLKGSRLITPKIHPPQDPSHVQSLSWTATPGATNYEVELAYRFLDEDDFQTPEKFTSNAASIFFDKLKPGIYRARVQAKGEKRTTSEHGAIEFVVKPSASDLSAAIGR